MKNRYRVEIIQKTIMPITVFANNKQEAIDKVLQQKGEAGDCYCSEEIEIKSANRLEELI